MRQVKCTYCNSEAVSPQHVKPPLCAKHHAIIILLCRARRLSLAVTVENLTTLLAQANGTLRVEAAEIPQLLRDVE